MRGLARFWEKVDRSGGPDACWPWKAARNQKGYGTFKLDRYTTVRAHRYAFQVAVGPLREDEMACHRCDHPWCCNPKHLWRGNAYCNNMDRDRKGRRGYTGRDQRGERNPSAVLSEENVRAIRSRLVFETNVDLAEEFGVHHATISLIRRGKTWRKTRHPEQPWTSFRAK